MRERCERFDREGGTVMVRTGFCVMSLRGVAIEGWESDTRLGLPVVCFDCEEASTARRLFRRSTMRARQQQYTMTVMTGV